MWTLISIFVLLGAVGAIVWYYAKEFDIWRRDGEPETGFAAKDFMDGAVVTPSMRATAWFFMVVAALFVVQVLLGIITAHYAVEGQGIYGLPFADLFPYAVTRTWHTQLAVLWIATAWLATGLYVAPLFGGREPRFQATILPREDIERWRPVVIAVGKPAYENRRDRNGQLIDWIAWHSSDSDFKREWSQYCHERSTDIWDVYRRCDLAPAG